jgi:large subunit ribosomal protein L28
MASKDEITGKGKQHGHNVSDSLQRTKRVFKPNLQKKTFIINGKKVHLSVAASTIRTLKKKGIGSITNSAVTLGRSN